MFTNLPDHEREAFFEIMDECVSCLRLDQDLGR